MGLKWHGEKVIKQLREAIEPALLAAGLVLDGAAKTYCAVDTGRLRNSITVKTERRQSESAARTPEDILQDPPAPNTAHVGTNVSYAAYVEYGTVRMKPQAFLREALSRDGERATLEGGKILGEALGGGA